MQHVAYNIGKIRSTAASRCMHACAIVFERMPEWSIGIGRLSQGLTTSAGSGAT
jgi:hypothetical protein